MTFSDQFRARMNAIGSDRKTRMYNRKLHEFNIYMAETLNKEPCKVDGVETELVFQDHSQSNNKDLSDDKYVIAPNSVAIDVGSYVEWRNEEWLVFTEEFKTIPTHQQLKIKHVNRRLKWLVDKEKKTICNNGNGWGAYIQNQTLYTLGVSFSGQHMPLANAKMSVFIKDTPETRNITVGTRLFIAGQVYKVEFADYVSRVGLVNWLLDEDTKNPETDNFELEVADYWDSGEPSTPQPKGGDGQKDDHSESTETSSEGVQPKVEWNIEGETRARLGRSYTYSVKADDGYEPEVTEWIVGDIEAIPFYIIEKNSQSITIKVKDDFRVVGQVATIAAKANNEIKNIAIKIIKKFG